MGVLINKTEEKSILIKGTEIEVPSVYGRLTFVAREDGQTLEVVVTTYASKDAYKGGSSPLTTDVPTGSFKVEELAPEETQGVETAHKYAIQVYNDLGYDTTEL
jgi:hypothetical protein